MPRSISSHRFLPTIPTEATRHHEPEAMDHRRARRAHGGHHGDSGSTAKQAMRKGAYR